MRFSEYFQIDPKKLKEYGAYDISLVCDMPLFIDPMLIFTSSKQEYQELHAKIIEYFFHIHTLSESDNLTSHEKYLWLTFREIKNNWLGYSIYGNAGLGPGKKFADDLYRNLKHIFPKDKISESYHIERIIFFGKQIGKDKISDLIVNILFEYFLEYTQTFAIRHIDSQFLKKYSPKRIVYNDDSKSLQFSDVDYTLPFKENDKGEDEFVLLTPKDILRSDEQAINMKDFVQSFEGVLESIDNEMLRSALGNHLISSVEELIEEAIEQGQSYPTEQMKETRKKQAFEEFARVIDSRVFDYYMRLKEGQGQAIQTSSAQEVATQDDKFFRNSEKLAQLVLANSEPIDHISDLKKEGFRQIQVLKRSIENGGAEYLNYANKPIKNEQDLRRLLWLTFQNVFYQMTSRGGDSALTKRMGIAKRRYSLKLASNPQLGKWLDNSSQKVKSRWDQKNPVVIFYFDEGQLDEVKKVIGRANLKPKVDELIFFIDCNVAIKNDRGD